VVDWLWIPAVIAGYFGVTRWLLPRLGVKT
jgi:hypothetical protein